MRFVKGGEILSRGASAPLRPPPPLNEALHIACATSRSKVIAIEIFEDRIEVTTHYLDDVMHDVGLWTLRYM